MSAATAILSRGNWVRHTAGVLSVRRLNLWAGGIIVASLLTVGLLAPWIAPYGPNEFDFQARLAGFGDTHLLGTDSFGRDILSQAIYATRTDLLVGFLSAVCAFLIGAAIGSLPGALGRWVDAIVKRDDIIDIAFPPIVVPVAFILGPSLVNFVVALSLVGWVSYARLMRMPALKGLAVVACIVFALSDVVLAVLVLVPLSFLGLGVQPPTAEWGVMILMGLHDARSTWWVPGLAFVLMIVGCSLLAQGLADRFGLRQS